MWAGDHATSCCEEDEKPSTCACSPADNLGWETEQTQSHLSMLSSDPSQVNMASPVLFSFHLYKVVLDRGPSNQLSSWSAYNSPLIKSGHSEKLCPHKCYPD